MAAILAVGMNMPGTGYDFGFHIFCMNAMKSFGSSGVVKAGSRAGRGQR
jgi:hypothetical protein